MTSAGPDVPTMDTLTRMMSAGAQFESYRRNFTDASNPADGVIYWMLNSGWTSLHWQLFDAFLDQNGAYYGAKKANEPLHVQWSYDNRSVVVVNQRHASAGGLTARVSLYNPDGTQVYTQTSTTLTVPGDGGRATALTGKTPAFYVDAHVVGAAGRPVLPVRWDDNEISLWPGESRTLTATYRTADLAGASPSVRVSGWNVATQTVPVSAGANTVRATATTAGGGPDVDHLDVR